MNSKEQKSEEKKLFLFISFGSLIIFEIQF